MAQSALLLSRIVAYSISATVRAGKIIRDVMQQGGLNIVDKGKNDIQTEADRSAQRCIIASLSHQFPNITIIGEEGLSNCEVPSDWIVTEADQEILKLKLPQHLEDVDPKDICVWVDPLDGTLEYAQGLVEHVTVLVGVAVGHRAIGGVIHQPYYKNTESDIPGRTLWGINGVGFGGFVPLAPPDGRKIITTTRYNLVLKWWKLKLITGGYHTSTRIYSYRSHSNHNVQAAINALLPDEVVRVGGAGYKVILLLEGKAHAYVLASRGCKRWDTCAPEAVLHAVGGTLTDFYGEHYSYRADTTYSNERGILATAPGQSHQWYLDQIPHEVKQKLGHTCT